MLFLEEFAIMCVDDDITCIGQLCGQLLGKKWILAELQRTRGQDRCFKSLDCSR